MIQNQQKRSVFNLEILRGEFSDEMVVKVTSEGETKHFSGRRAILFSAMFDGLWAQPNDKEAERRINGETY